MIKRELTNTYLSSFDLLTEALYLCWSNSFSYETNTLDKRKLKDQIRSYGFYDHKYAARKEIPINFINNFEFKTLIWVNHFSDAVNQDELCEYIELYKQVIDEVENNLFQLKNRDERIAYANILLRNFDKSHIHKRKVDVAERNRLYKENFEVILDRKFLSEDGVSIQDNECSRTYPNYDLTARLINHFDFIDKLIELFYCFEVDLISLANQSKHNLYIFNDSQSYNLNCCDLKKMSSNSPFENAKCKSCKKHCCKKSDCHKIETTINKDEPVYHIHEYKQDIHPKFNSTLSDDCLIKIMHYLSNKNKLINANIDTWLYWFNRKYIKVPEPLKWNSSPTMLSNIIQQLCGESISTIVKNAFCTKTYVKPTKHKYERSRMHKEIEQIIIISKQKK